jgi:ADP-heptose:LPS heptosyltransferase
MTKPAMNIFRLRSKGGARPPGREGLPDRILIIRMHAIGDVAITFPMCAALRTHLPGKQIDFLTSEAIAPMAGALTTFDHIVPFPECTSRTERIRQVVTLARTLREQRYGMVLDLQTNWVSRALRRGISPEAWGEFDRVSPLPAALRVSRAFDRVLRTELEPQYDLPVRDSLQHKASELLESEGLIPGTKLVLLNPAGLWVTRNWPVSSYVELARLLLREGEFSFLLLGTGRIADKAAYLQRELGPTVINLESKTTLADTVAILRHVSLAVSEDSGLMHMAWACGVPTIALFGSSRHDWSSPVGNHVRVFHSGDLPCGSCMNALCRFGDVHCLTRVTAGQVFSAAMELLQLKAGSPLP